MSASFKAFGVVDTSPFVADLAPNASAPVAARIFEIPDRTEQGGIANGVKVYVEFSNITGTPAIDVVPWFFDEAASNWMRGVAITGIENFDAIQLLQVAPARFFLQVTAFAGGTADDVTLYAAAI